MKLNNRTSQLKVAIVHDSMMEYGGAERLASHIIELFPKADIYTSSFNQQVKDKITQRQVFTSFVHNFPYLRNKTSLIQLLSPLIWSSFKLSNYDLVITSSSFGLSNTIKTKGVKIDYIHSLPKNIFNLSEKWTLQKIVPYTSFIKNLYLKSINNSQYLIVNSRNIQLVVRRHTGKQSTIVYPPIVFPKKTSSKKTPPSAFFLTVSRLSKEKNIELIIRAFNEVSTPLHIVGSGKDIQYLAYLKKLAKPHIKFLGFVSDNKRNKLYSTASGLIHCHLNEDFGMVIGEAMAHGCPVIAYNHGGPKEIIISGSTGVLFDKPNKTSLLEAIQRFNKTKFSKDKIINYARKYSSKNFSKLILDYVDNAIKRKNSHRKKILAVYLLNQAGETVSFENQLKMIGNHYDLDIIKITPPHLVWDKAKKYQLFKHYLSSYRKYIKVLRNKLSRHSYDLILTTILPLPIITKIIAKNRKFKTAYCFHGIKHLSPITEAKIKKHSILKRVFYMVPLHSLATLVELFSGLVIDLIILPSKSSKGVLPFALVARNKPTKVIYNSISTKEIIHQSFTSPTKPYQICYFGRLHRYKGVHRLIKSFRYLSNSKYQLNLFCLPSDSKKYHKYILSLVKNKKNIKLLFNLPEKKLIKALRSQHLCLLPSDIELFPMSYLESLSQGVPMITTQVGDLSYLQSKIEPKLLLKNSQPETISKKIEWYFHLSKNEKESIQKKGFDLLNTFSNQNVCKKIIKTINEV